MSLPEIAKQLAAKGRGGDELLVHMTKGEVAGLQQLAMAAGGSLTINPDTGLPEASFLRNLLPTIIGFGLAPFTGGLSAAAIGAGTGAMLNKENPLMGAITGGLGAFGGANLAGGLSAAGGAGTAGAGTAGATGAAAGFTPVTPPSFVMPPPTGAEFTPVASAAPASSFVMPPPTPPVTYSSMYEGIGALGGEQGRGAFMDAMGGGKGLLRSGMMAAAPMAMPGRQRPVTEEGDSEDVMGRYTYDPGYTGGTRTPGSAYTSERRFFNPRYIRNAQGGEVKKYADGGEMSAPSSDPARGMTGASADAMRYLYGMQEQSPALEARLMAAEQLKAEPVQIPAGTPRRTQSDNPLSVLGPLLGGQNSIFTRAIMGDSGGQSPGVLYRQVDAGYDFNPQTQQYTKRYEYQPYVPSVPSGGFGGFSEGGITDLAKGGMKSGGFVIPADVVSMIGEGNTEAGYEEIKQVIPGAVPIKGKDGGQADTVATSIEGKQPARVAHGEMYVPPAAVKRAGGAKKLYAMMKNVRKMAKGDAKQIKPVDLKKAMA